MGAADVVDGIWVDGSLLFKFEGLSMGDSWTELYNYNCFLNKSFAFLF